MCLKISIVVILHASLHIDQFYNSNKYHQNISNCCRETLRKQKIKKNMKQGTKYKNEDKQSCRKIKSNEYNFFILKHGSAYMHIFTFYSLSLSLFD